KSGTTTNDYPLTTTNNLYLDFAVINNGTAATGRGFTNELYLDGVLRISPYLSGGSSLMNGFWITISDYSPGMLTEGQHTLRVKADSSNVINELDEGDNEYTRTFMVLMPPGFVAAWGYNGYDETTVPPGLSNLVGL